MIVDGWSTWRRLSTRPPGNATATSRVSPGREYRLEIDQGGHLVATRFGGPGEGINLVPMSRELNGAGQNNWYAMESDWAKTLDTDPPPEIKVKIDLDYPGGSKRPESFTVGYTVDGGKPKFRRFVQ
jgi:filamentous hemagglutinin